MFKEGDWIFYEYELSCVERAEDGRVRSVSNGIGTTSGHDLSPKCCRLGMDEKRVSDEYAFIERKIRQADTGSIINWPDMHRLIVRKWLETLAVKDDAKALRQKFKENAEFLRSVLDEIENAKGKALHGIKLFK